MRRKEVAIKATVYNYDLLRLEGDKVVERKSVKSTTPLKAKDVLEDSPGFIRSNPDVRKTTEVYYMPIEDFISLAKTREVIEGEQINIEE